MYYIFLLLFIVYPKHVCVQLLSEEDGKPDIVKTAKKISSDYSSKKIKFKDIDIDFIDKSLKGIKGKSKK